MTVESVEIVLKPAYRKFNYLYIPASQTKSFPSASPGTRVPVTIEAEGRSLDAELQYNSKAHVWFLKMRDWFQSHSDLPPGTKIEITPVKPGKRYRLRVIETSD